MIRFAAAFLVATGLVLTSTANAADKKLKIGDSAPVFTGLEGVDGKTHSLADLKAKDVVVVVITCNHCPVAVAYEDRIIDFAKKYASGSDSKVGLVAINVNKSEADSLPKMKERAKEKGFNFAYLFDPSQKIARQLDATVTPEFYVLNKERKLVYMGAMDDTMNAAKVKVNYLEAAVKATLEGKMPETTQTKARGCGVKYEN